MELLDVTALLITLTAVFSYINYRYLHFPTSIGLMLISLVVSLVIIASGWLGLGIFEKARLMVAELHFSQALMHGMLSFLLFAGALHVRLDDLAEQKWVIFILATGGVLISTIVVGFLAWWTLDWLGMGVSPVYAFLFGALISPTDPIAVLAILKDAGAPRSLEAKIAGESLFNDGVGVVVFLVLLKIATGGATTITDIAALFLEEAVGGAVYGLAIGGVAYGMLKSVDNYQVEVLLTLALVMGGYALAERLGVSGPIAMVVAGLLIGSKGRALAMSDETRERLDTFWELVDEILNAVLFVLIGLEILTLSFTIGYLYAGLLVIPIALFARFISVGALMTVLRRFRAFEPHTVKILTWGGLRGGISVALALSLPLVGERDVILASTYAVVVFSILVQGVTIEKVFQAGGRI